MYVFMTEGRYDQEQGICIMVSVLGIYVSYHTLCAAAITRIQVHLFIMIKTTNSLDVTSALIL
jgi:hypothetical protein